MIRALIVLALLLAPDWQVVKGKRFDVYASRRAAASKRAPAAEETAKRFEELLGDFPGDRAAVLLRGEEDPVDPDWRKDGAAWMFTYFRPEIVLFRIGVADTFTHDLAIRTLLEWSDLRAEDPPRGDGSGTRLADWWEEAVSGWCEGQAVRDSRRWTMADILCLGKELPLDRLFSLTRDADPGTVDLQVPGLRAGRLKPPVLPAQAFSFLEYLVENEGVPFVQHIADLQARGLGIVNALPWLKEHAKDRAKPKTPVPGTVRDLEKAWLAWARARRI